MNEVQLRQWVEANPGRVNVRDEDGYTPLHEAVWVLKSLPLIVWLLDEKGADVNAPNEDGDVSICVAPSLDILTALLDRGADPTVRDINGWSPLICQAFEGIVENVTCLLQYPRVRAAVNEQDWDGNTVLHFACNNRDETAVTSIFHLLLQAGASPNIINNNGQTPLAWLRQVRPSYHAVIALLQQYPEAQQEAEETSLLVKVRRLAVAANSNTVAPSCLQARVARGQPLPQLALMPVMGGQNEDEEEEERRKLRTLMAFPLGMEGGWKNAGMPRDVFGVVLDLFMLTWDPLRRTNTGTGPPAVQG